MHLEVVEKPVSQVVEQRLTLYGVTWEQYEIVRTSLDNCAGLRMTYLEGTLEFFMPSIEHEIIKKVLARLIELYSIETNTRLYGYGSTTYRKQAKERGLEPDECYCIGTVKFGKKVDFLYSIWKGRIISKFKIADFCQI
jgi:Uma2 family endonuclease